MLRALGIDRLVLRLAVGITTLVVGLLALLFYTQSRRHLDALIDQQRASAERQSQLLETTLRHQMIEKNSSLIDAILREIGTQPNVQNAMILDHQGVIRFAGRKALVGQQVPRDSPTCMVCHAKEPAQRARWVLMDEEGVETLRSVRPIENRPECYECHAPTQRINGMLILDVSLAEARAQMTAEMKNAAAGIGVLGILLLAGMGLLFRTVVLRRLTQVSRAARSIAEGNLAERAIGNGPDLITALATDVNSMADATSRLAAEVREQGAQLASVMNSLDDGLVVLDRDFEVLAANLSFCKRLGTHPEAIRGRRCPEMIRPNCPCHAAGIPCPTARCMERGEVQRETLRVPSAAGAPDLALEVHASPVFDDGGKVVRVVEIWRDISEREREEARLAEIERLVSLGVLASGFSHEMNTPLASIVTCAEGILRRGESADDGADPATRLASALEHAGIIRQEVLRCRRITDQFLRFARGIPPSIEPIDLRTVAESVLALAGVAARDAGASLRIEGETSVPVASANLEVVQHVLLNLLINAIQCYDRRGGRIVVRVLAADAAPRIQVEDDGCGIPPDARAHLFEPFRSRKPRGTGLGLFLSRTFMRRFKGDVRLVDSEVGKGSTFEVLFAAAPGGTA